MIENWKAARRAKASARNSEKRPVESLMVLFASKQARHSRENVGDDPEPSGRHERVEQDIARSRSIASPHTVQGKLADAFHRSGCEAGA